MAKNQIVIDGYIGGWEFSKQYVRQMLAEAGDGEVEVLLSSLGGSVSHALDIHDQFVAHGKVNINLTGFNASSSTIISLGGKKIRASKNSLYLIHKVAIGIDLYGQFNVEKLDELIEELQKAKDENAKMDQMIALMYLRRAKAKGKSLADVLDLMKKDTWLTSEEAAEWGFIDEIYEPSSNQVNMYLSHSRVAMVSANNLPPLPSSFTEKENDSADSAFQKFLTLFENFIKPKDKPMNKQFSRLNQALKVNELKEPLTEDQLNTIDQELQRIDTAETARTAAEQARDQAVNDKTAAEQNHSNAMALFDAIDATVAAAKTPEEKVSAIKALLAAKPGVKPVGTQTNKDGNQSDDGVDWDTLMNLPHMKEGI